MGRELNAYSIGRLLRSLSRDRRRYLNFRPRTEYGTNGKHRTIRRSRERRNGANINANQKTSRDTKGEEEEEDRKRIGRRQCCQISKFDPFLSLDCARVKGAIQGKEGIKFCSVAIVLQVRRAKHIQSKNLAMAIWQP